MCVDILLNFTCVYGYVGKGGMCNNVPVWITKVLTQNFVNIKFGNLDVEYLYEKSFTCINKGVCI